MIEQIARHLCRADGYDPDITGSTGNPRWWLYTRTAEHTIPLLAEAWDGGKRAGLRQSDWEHGDTPTMYVAVNPYRKEQAEMNSDLAEAWDKGAETAWNRSTPEVNGTRYHWRHEGEPVNPYRKAQTND